MFGLNVCSTYEEVCRNAFEQVVLSVGKNPKALICVATGESPIGVYRLFPEHSELFRNIKILKLDEWGGIKPNDPSTCETYIKENIIQPLGINDKQLLGFRSDAGNPEDECERIKSIINQYNGIDVCILGVGVDGHIGLNYPADTIIPEAHIVPAHYLTHSMLNKAQEKPTHGYTLGFKEILNSKEIILIVKGTSKKETLKLLLKGEITTHFPASLLLLSKNFTVYCDKDAYGE
ncbi:MAG TPA: 6-phosphogluconolactonase [Candidatus Hydrogenedens sp.]|nr:6-phosphogluconolactonase [Candidatus Hydrogenedens sp.]HOL20753.1 6-phosphogluconolactonase [Candidatus Hydrogenedens sp.]HPP58365.1 6-phosphogluconolactonase [Candidatus Hydrogenedens sp.]